MGAFEDLIHETVETVLVPGRAVTLLEIERAVRLRARRPVHGSTELPAAILVVLMAHPERFVEVAPGTWVRRDDGPEAGAPTRPLRPPLAGGAAAAVAPPEAQTDVEAISAPAG